MRTKLVALCLTLVAAAALASTAAADKVFHTLHADVVSANGAPLKSGFVNDVHTNGVVNAAHEIYQLNGARPNTTYQVVLLAYVGDTTCSGTPTLVIPSTTVTTNGAGNGTGHNTFPATGPSPLAGTPIGIVWTFVGPTGVDYRTGCELVVTD